MMARRDTKKIDSKRLRGLLAIKSNQIAQPLLASVLMRHGATKMVTATIHHLHPLSEPTLSVGLELIEYTVRVRQSYAVYAIR
jgi:hypothetical protein